MEIIMILNSKSINLKIIAIYLYASKMYTNASCNRRDIIKFVEIIQTSLFLKS